MTHKFKYGSVPYLKKKKRRGWSATSDIVQRISDHFIYGRGNAGHLDKFWGMVRMGTIREELRTKAERWPAAQTAEESLVLEGQEVKGCALPLAPPGFILERCPGIPVRPSTYILINSGIQCGPRFILGKNWLSKLPLFFSKTKKMLIGKNEGDKLNPKLHTYIQYPRGQMGDKQIRKIN